MAHGNRDPRLEHGQAEVMEGIFEFQPSPGPMADERELCHQLYDVPGGQS